MPFWGSPKPRPDDKQQPCGIAFFVLKPKRSVKDTDLDNFNFDNYEEMSDEQPETGADKEQEDEE